MGIFLMENKINPLRNDSTINLEDKISDLNQQIDKHSNVPLKSRLSSQIDTISNLQVPSEEMRRKLRFVNQNLRDYLLEESGKSLEISPDKMKESAPLMERRSESLPPAIEEIITKELAVDTPIKMLPEERVSLALPFLGASSQKRTVQRLGIGLNLGTTNIIAAREAGDNRVFVKSERNHFLTVRSDQARF